ncbi:MAG: hypothetical protein KKH28_04590 [Elusimicrobia bacterium]|nr:hypothetical protein [Elusimicrobiota bacterium]
MRDEGWKRVTYMGIEREKRERTSGKILFSSFPSFILHPSAFILSAFIPQPSSFLFAVLFFSSFILHPSSLLHAADDQPLAAMGDELARSMAKLKMDDLARPYYVGYYMLESSNVYVSASFGAVISTSAGVSRSLAADVRIGSRSFDNTGYAGDDYQSYRPFYASAPEEEDYDALRFSLWSLTDQAYKGALETYSRKKAYLKKKNLKEIYDDLSAEKPEVLIEEGPGAADFDPGKWKEYVKKLSAVFKKYPRIQNSDVSADYAARTYRFVNSEGSRYRFRRDKLTLSISAAVQTGEGLKFNDGREFHWPTLAAAPAFEALAAETEKFAGEMSWLVDSSTAGIYLGPVLFEDQAAAEFFNQLLVENVSFVKAPLADNDEYRKYYVDSGAFLNKLNMRVTAPFLNVYDDPLQAEFRGTELMGSYRIDTEGVRPGKLELVRNGKLVNFYMSRSPVKRFKTSNGHGRGHITEFPSARPGNVFIMSERTASRAELKKKMLETAKELELDYAVIIRRMAPADTKRMEELLAKPALVYKVSVKDGSEELVNGVEFTGVGFRALRDIILTSDEHYVYNFYQPGPLYYSRGYVPAAIIAPSSILVQEMELQKTEQKPDRQPYLPHPYFGEGKGKGKGF